MRKFFFIVLSAFIGFSCNSQVDNHLPTEVSLIETTSDTTNSNILSKIEPNRFWAPKGSLWRIECWVFDHYEPISGKLVGVWPDTFSSTRLTELYKKCGFRGVWVDQGTFWSALAAGFKPSSMMVGIDKSNYQTVVQNCNARAYYVDEPTDHDCIHGPRYSDDELLSISNYIHSYRPGSKFIIGGYRRCLHFQDAGWGRADYVMFSSYKHWFNINPYNKECWAWISQDQRQSWSDMKSLFGRKFMSTWIMGTADINSSDYDGDEYPDLTGHATNLGLEEIWYFIGTGTSQTEISNFTYSAWKAGWLRRFERLTYLVYECTCNGGCYDFPPSNCWSYLRTEQTNTHT